MKVLQEEDRVSGRTVTIVAAVTIAIGAAGIAVAWWILSATAESRQPALPGPHEPIAMETSEVDRWLFRERRDLSVRRAAMLHLDSYGWVDREQGIIHVPIRRAMELYLDRQGSAIPIYLQSGPSRPLRNAPEDTP